MLATRRFHADYTRPAVPPSIAGGIAFLVVWSALSRPAPEATVAGDHVRLAPDAHGSDVVTVILADFRGLDTLGEVTVVFLAVLGITVLLGSLRNPRVQEQAR